MDGIASAWEALISGDALSFAGIGVLIAVALIVGLRFLLPHAELGKLRAPIGLLVAHLATVLLAAVTDPDGSAHNAIRVAGVLLLLISIARSGFLVLVDSLLVRRFSRPIPKIFRDICEGLVYMAAVLITLRQAGAQLDALLTTSALLTAVIGLSLQDTLGNLFAGLSIQAQNPFEVGDWIQYGDDTQMTGKVIEINWRATKVLTLDDVEVVIPNGPLARAPLRNFTKPTRASRRSLYVVVSFDIPPHRVKAAILEGLEATRGLLRRPEPSVLTESFEERGVRYWIRFHTSDFDRREVTDALAMDRVWYALRRANIPIAVPIADIEVNQDDESARARLRSEALTRRQQVLRRVDFLRSLEEEQIEALARSVRERPYAPGELVVKKGEGGHEFFIVQHGEVAVVLETEGTEIEVARLSEGSFFGEMSVMTGQPRTASVRTMVDTQLLVVDRNSLQEVLDNNPELAERISDVLATRQQQLDAASSKTHQPVAPRENFAQRNELLHRIKEFFSLSN